MALTSLASVHVASISSCVIAPAGKMLLYGVLFSCLDPVLTVACCMAYRCACFVQPAGMHATALHSRHHGGVLSCSANAVQANLQAGAKSCVLPVPLLSARDPWVLPAATDARRQAALIRARLAR